LSPTLRALSEIGFIDCVKKDQITFVVFHILGPSIASLDEIAEIARSVGNASYFLVKNRISDTTFFEWDPATYNAYFKQIKDVAEINIPKLNEKACERVEVAGTPFVSFITNKTARDEKANYSFVLRGYVRHWLGNVWSEYDRVNLMDLVLPSSDPENEEEDMKASA